MRKGISENLETCKNLSKSCETEMDLFYLRTLVDLMRVFDCEFEVKKTRQEEVLSQKLPLLVVDFLPISMEKFEQFLWSKFCDNSKTGIVSKLKLLVSKMRKLFVLVSGLRFQNLPNAKKLLLYMYDHDEYQNKISNIDEEGGWVKELDDKIKEFMMDCTSLNQDFTNEGNLDMGNT